MDDIHVRAGVSLKVQYIIITHLLIIHSVGRSVRENDMQQSSGGSWAKYSIFSIANIFWVRWFHSPHHKPGFILRDAVDRCMYLVPSVPVKNHVAPCGRMRGNRITSRILSAPVSIISKRSTPIPNPPAGGIPYFKALRKS